MFTEKFVQILQERQITAYKVAKETGISQGLMGEYKKGIKLPTLNNLIKIANYFDCSVDYLLGRTDTPSSQTEAKEWNPTFDNYLKLDPFSKTRVDQYVEILLEENQIKNIKIVESDRGQVAAFGGGMGTPEKTESHLTEEDVRKLIEEYMDKD